MATTQEQPRIGSRRSEWLKNAATMAMLVGMGMAALLYVVDGHTFPW